MSRIANWILPVLVIVVAIVAMRVLSSMRADPVVVPLEQIFPLVRVITVQPTTFDHVVRSQGTVRPLGEIELIPEVGGKVRNVSPSLRAGAYFEEGEVLIEVDPEDYERAVTMAATLLREAELALATERAEARVAREELGNLGAGEPTELARREPQLRLAEARLESAQAALDQARRDLERTQIVAPFTGRVLEDRVGLGQVLTPGVGIAVLYRTDRAEVVLPIADSELAHIDLALFPQGESKVDGPRVTLSTRFAGKLRSWEGRIRRIEGQLDPKTRMVRLVAEVEDPYRRTEGSDVPLAPGLYVEAQIEGREVSGVFVLPRAAWHEGTRILVVDNEGRLDLRTPQLESQGRDDIVVREGLSAGERVVVSPLEVVVDGMRVEVKEDEASP